MNVCEACLFGKYAVNEEPGVDGGTIALGEFVGCVLLEVDDLMGGFGRAHHESVEGLQTEDQVWKVAPSAKGRAATEGEVNMLASGSRVSVFGRRASAGRDEAGTARDWPNASGPVGYLSQRSTRITSHLCTDGISASLPVELTVTVMKAVNEEPGVDGGTIAPGEFVGCVSLGGWRRKGTP